MKIAYLHVLPLEYYPPATNTLGTLANVPGFDVRAYSTHNVKGIAAFDHPLVRVQRSPPLGRERPILRRMLGYLRWPLATVSALVRWRPDAVISVEPHSALAAWLYLRVVRGRGRLVIHHHEYYAPADFGRPGMRVLRAYRRLERDSLFPQAIWISQTNDVRLRLLRAECPDIPPERFRTLPNYPPRSWGTAVPRPRCSLAGRRLRLVYVGSASFEDTFIREVIEWAATRLDRVELHVSGFNVAEHVWSWLESSAPSNVTWTRAGWPYHELPARLGEFDVGLILYKGNTLNFVHNAPNKLFEYLACRLSVWYPPVMEGVRRVSHELPEQPIREVDFTSSEALDLSLLAAISASPSAALRRCAEEALAPLIATLQGLRC